MEAAVVWYFPLPAEPRVLGCAEVAGLRKGAPGLEPDYMGYAGRSG